MAQDPDHDRIAAKAHELWEAAGKPHGKDQDHWEQARELVAIEDSMGDTLLPRDTGVEEPVEEPEEALRNLADMPNLTDQGENLLTSTDREPALIATPSARRGRKPKAEVPISDQPGIPPKARKVSPKAGAKAEPAAEAAPPAAQPKTASVPKIAEAEPVKPEAKKAGAGRSKAR